MIKIEIIEDGELTISKWQRESQNDEWLEMPNGEEPNIYIQNILKHSALIERRKSKII